MKNAWTLGVFLFITPKELCKKDEKENFQGPFGRVYKNNTK